MRAKFWLKVWREGRLGFHQQEINHHLIEFFPLLNLKSNATVFVPLAGKSRDILWLRDKGCQVLAVELSRVAVEAFFAEANLVPDVKVEGSFEWWSSEGITFLVGDFFNLTPEHLANVDWFYDRASLIALPLEMRARYAAQLQRGLPAGTPGLLLTVEYHQDEMNGPPFAVREDEVRRLFTENFSLERKFSEDILEQTQFRERLSELVEKVFVLRSSVGA